MLTANTLALERMRKYLREGSTEIGQMMIEGGCQTFEEYRFHVGRCRGLQEALDLCDTIETELAKS